jgi:serine/threonine protein kinase
MSLIGLRVGPFEIVDEAVVPETGAWYRASRVGMTQRQPSEVLVKVIGPDATAVDRASLQLEYEVLRALDNASIPKPVAYYEGSGALAVEDAPGVALEALLAPPSDTPEAIGPATWLDVALDVSEALQHAHDHGVVHGHLSTHNVLLSAEGQVWIWGFGPAGHAVPDPAWMAPERAEGAQATEATDQWALAAMLAATLTGQPPWTGEDPVAMAHKGDTSHLVDPIEAQWPALARAMRRMLDPHPENRFESMQAARQELLTLARQVEGVAERRALGAWAANLAEEAALSPLDSAEVETEDGDLADVSDDLVLVEDLPDIDDVSQELILEDLPLQDDLSDELIPVDHSDMEPTVLYDAGPPAPADDEVSEATVLYDPNQRARRTGQHPDGTPLDQEATVLFTDHEVRGHVVMESPDVDTDVNRQIEEGVFAEDEEDSLEQTFDTSAVPLPNEELEEPETAGPPPLDLPTEDTGDGFPPLPVYDEEESGPYHSAIDLTEIDTAPNEELESAPRTAPFRPISPPERIASALLATLAFLVLVWFFVRILA